MPRNTSKQEQLDQRRRVVAALRLRGLTQREIVAALPERGILNPNTGKPYTLPQINRDLKVLRDEWREAAAADMADLKAQQLAELREARRRAWGDADMSEVRLNLKQEIELTGTEAPKKTEISGEIPIVILPEGAVDDLT